MNHLPPMRGVTTCNFASVATDPLWHLTPGRRRCRVCHTRGSSVVATCNPIRSQDELRGCLPRFLVCATDVSRVDHRSLNRATSSQTLLDSVTRAARGSQTLIVFFSFFVPLQICISVKGGTAGAHPPPCHARRQSQHVSIDKDKLSIVSVPPLSRNMTQPPPNPRDTYNVHPSQHGMPSIFEISMS